MRPVMQYVYSCALGDECPVCKLSGDFVSRICYHKYILDIVNQPGIHQLQYCRAATLQIMTLLKLLTAQKSTGLEKDFLHQVHPIDLSCAGQFLLHVLCQASSCLEKQMSHVRFMTSELYITMCSDPITYEADICSYGSWQYRVHC